MTDKEIEATTAHLNREAILQAKYAVEFGFIDLARLLKECRDKMYWKPLGYESFEYFLMDPDLSFKRSTAYNLIGLYERYVDRMGQDTKLLAEIGSSKLTVIAPVVESNPEEWMGKARGLGKMDLINEVRNAQGRGDMPPASGNPVQPVGPELSAQSWKNFEAFKKSAGCAVCGSEEVEKAHYPTSRGAGADDEAWVPLCHPCHADLHQRGVDTWTAENKRNLWRWVYSTLERAYSIGGE